MCLALQSAHANCIDVVATQKKIFDSGKLLVFVCPMLKFLLAGVVFTWTELMSATEQRSLSNLLGEGRFGCVYRGMLRHTTVAVKFLNKVSSESICSFLAVIWHPHRKHPILWEVQMRC